tara:strand:+ start:1042 stop:1203 length:162 start_codon:yes stop_codon:yes gene_type:complete
MMDLAKAEDKAINVLQGVGEGFLVMLVPTISIFLVVGLSRRMMNFVMKKAAGE